MKKYFIILFTLFITCVAMAQTEQSCSTCLPEGITFTTQAQIDNFQINYPGCTEIEGDVDIRGEGITNLSGLDVLASIGGSLEIWMTEVTSLTGLEGLTSIGGNLEIRHNDALTSLTGLENLNSIGGNLRIRLNDYLTSLTGLENIDPGSIENIEIAANSNLSVCNIQSICNYLAAPNGTITIGNNAPGCNSNNEVAEACGYTFPFDLIFTSQSQIDSFQINYPGVTEIWMNLWIMGDDITNLVGLNVITSIGGNLRISNNSSLTSLTGLEGVISIGGSLRISDNYALTSLTTLEGLTSIGGDLRIWDNINLTSLSGLNNISSIGGMLDISENDMLISMAGLEGLNDIMGALNFYYNESLTNLSGLSNLSSVGGDLRIELNGQLTSLTGLEGLTSIGGNLGIYENPELESLMGLDNLNTISGNLGIGFYQYPEGVYYGGNPSLTNLEGLENLSSIGGDLSISNNALLSSLAGLENLNGISLNDIFICHNPSLNNCDIQSLCDFLVSPNGSVNIYNNAPGCNNPAEVASNCGITLPCLPYGNYYFLTQSDIDNFETNYPGCNNLEGDVSIGLIFSSGIIDLSGLSAITSIGGDLNIINEDFLTSLEGLEGLTSINGNMLIHGNETLNNLEGLEGLTTIAGGLRIDGNDEWAGGNISLTSLDGLENLSSIGDYLILEVNPVLADITSLEGLTSIGGNLIINGNYSLPNLDGLNNLTTITGGLQIGGLYGNEALIDLSGLEGLTSIGGDIDIEGNYSLASLEGIDNIDAASIDNLYISGNGSLSTCEVESVCDYLTTPNGTVYISGNAPGCNSPLEVLENCGCFTEGITFTTQAQIDSFGVNFPYCAEIGGIEGEVIISGDDITNLYGLSTLTYFGSDLKFLFNENLTSLAGLHHVTSIGGTLHIEGNETMSNLWGLVNIEPGSISDLVIIDNPSLSGCNIQNICEYLTSPGGTIQIDNNAPGCNSQQEVEDVCSSCLPEGITFTTQAQIDSFLINYGTCSMIEGDLTINGEDISDLSGLGLITYIDGTVTIGNITGIANPQLTDLEGLNNLFFIGGNLKIYNNEALTSLEGFDNLGSVSGYLFIGDASFNAGNPALSSLSGLESLDYLGGSLKLSGNESLTSLTALSGLNIIGGPLRIKDNPILTSLAGLDNINPGSITYLQIIYNDFLYECEVQTVCDYLVAPNGNTDIYHNAPGCNSQEEVEEACETVSIDKVAFIKEVTTSPNPFITSTTLSYELQQPEKVTLNIYNHLGQLVYQKEENQPRGKQQLIWNAERFAEGVYYYRLQVGTQMVSGKLLKL